MKQYLNKTVKLEIEIKGKKPLFYTATITAITETHISFIDRYNKPYTYRIKDIVEITPVS